MDWRKTQVDPGASVEAADGPLGTVEEVIVSPQTGETSHLVIRRGSTTERLTIPVTEIAEVPNRHAVRLRVRRDELSSVRGGARSQMGGGVSESLTEARDTGQIRVPVLEERLQVGKTPTELGEVRLHKTIELFEEVARQPIMREDVVVERVERSEPLDAPAEARMEGDWFVVPIMEEVLVVQKRLMLTGEVRIKKRQVTEEYEVREQLRRERVEVEDATVHGVAGGDGIRRAPAAMRGDTVGGGAADATPVGTAPVGADRAAGAANARETGGTRR